VTLVIKKRGRPSKADVQARTTQKPKRSDAQILSDLKDRFNILGMLTTGAVGKNIRAVTVTGAPGVGKTYTVEQILEHFKEKQNTQFEIVKGALSAVNLYKLAYRNRKAGNVIVLDDADSIFNDEDALNLLKVLCDSSDIRKVSWMKESNALKEDDIPQSFEFAGAMIFISNLDFQRFVDEGKNKYAQHFEAIMSRSMYLDLRLHTRDELGVWIEHVATAGNIFRREGLTETQGKAVLSFLKVNRDVLRELSLRTLIKAAQLVKSHKEWEKMATVLLTK
jgi:predicted ATP-dependent serine protease